MWQATVAHPPLPGLPMDSPVRRPEAVNHAADKHGHISEFRHASLRPSSAPPSFLVHCQASERSALDSSMSLGADGTPVPNSHSGSLVPAASIEIQRKETALQSKPAVRSCPSQLAAAKTAQPGSRDLLAQHCAELWTASLRARSGCCYTGITVRGVVS